ncbi:GntR family transcriptional regulator [Bacillus sp. SD088]|uniref:GntR family transcriptional regulator n=1 Tax=Bacillus sp. SD088 TaxID=2782012 RepID=UPI0024187114|nr:GntR family transcriptional regulator [Bacillus sp. SD088]
MYIQISNFLTGKMEEGIYKMHDRLPSEAELAKQFNVSRITSKNALIKLAGDGKVYRIPGKGTFVAEPSRDEWARKETYSESKSDTPLIGLIMPEVVEQYSAQILSSVETAVNAMAYGLILKQSHHNSNVEKNAIKMMLKIGVKGLIIFPVDNQVYNEEILRLTLDGFPLVLLDRYLKGIETSAVYSDNVTGAYQLTKRLCEYQQKISLFTTPNYATITVEDRIKGFVQALEDAKMPIDRSSWFTDILHENVIEKAVGFLQANPDISGIFAMNAYAGKIAYQAAKRLDKQIPEEFSIASFDQDRELDLYPILTAKQNSEQMGEIAVKILQSQFKNEKEVQQIMVPVHINDQVIKTFEQEERQTFV